MGFMDEIKDEQKKYGSGPGDKFEFENKGVYRLRILNQPKVLATHFFGAGNPAITCIGIDEGCIYHKGDDKRPSIKLVTYVVDRNDGKVKLAELPLSISYGLNDLQQDADFAFEGFPMPYDVKITYDPDNKDPKAIYRLVASPKQEPLTDEEQVDLEEKMKKQTPEQYVEMRKKRQKEKGMPLQLPAEQKPDKGYEYPKEEINPDDVPF